MQLHLIDWILLYLLAGGVISYVGIVLDVVENGDRKLVWFLWPLWLIVEVIPLFWTLFVLSAEDKRNKLIVKRKQKRKVVAEKEKLLKAAMKELEDTM